VKLRSDPPAARRTIYVLFWRLVRWGRPRHGIVAPAGGVLLPVHMPGKGLTSNYADRVKVESPVEEFAAKVLDSEILRNLLTAD
jgi:hypothetical protein